jgi:hypothetical protein
MPETGRPNQPVFLDLSPGAVCFFLTLLSKPPSCGTIWFRYPDNETPDIEERCADRRFPDTLSFIPIPVTGAREQAKPEAYQKKFNMSQQGTFTGVVCGIRFASS